MNTYGIFNADRSMRTFVVGTKTQAKAQAEKIMQELGIEGLKVALLKH